SGYSYEVEFNPTTLAKKGIVVVSVGQRLNVFGYLALPQLSAEQDGISGNYGLMDEVKALDWVRENIAAFGGDPDNIT
ncbi:carboxylesterase family protein, partial [Acinetobacter baumannii]|nr:carboxylesterase family protein [Acinetobacter baumannii]